MHQIRFRLGLTALPQTPSCNLGVLLLREGGEGKGEGRGRKGEKGGERSGGEGKGGERRGREEKRICSPRKNFLATPLPR